MADPGASAEQSAPQPIDTAALAQTHGALMLDLARRTLAYAADAGRPPAVNLESFPEPLRAPGASFVTLEKEGRLRGCIGSLQAHRPLVRDVVENSFRAGSRDPRFPPLTKAELAAGIDCSLSLLSPPERMLIRDEADLLAQLRPGIDGLILADGAKRATFLPQVWDQLPEAATFLAHLKRKAGMAPDHWSPTVTAERYAAVKIA
jgi:AmmeMemoRadiSam system protein A